MPTTTTSSATPQRSRSRAIADAYASFPRFCGLLKIQPKPGAPGAVSGDRIPLVLSPQQLAYHRSRTRLDIILKGRQTHMTTGELARDLWTFLTQRGAKVRVVVQSMADQASQKDVAEKLRIMVDSLRQIGALPFTFSTESRFEYAINERDAHLSIIQAGASEASAEKKGRSGTITRCHVTEACYFEHADKTFSALIGSLARAGEFVVESTPSGAYGWYYEQWRAAVEGRSDFTPHFFPFWINPEYRTALTGPFVAADDAERAAIEAGCPVEALAWRREEIRRRGGNVAEVTQEYPVDAKTCFLMSGAGFFDRPTLTRMLHRASSVAPLEMFAVKKVPAEVGGVKLTKLERSIPTGDAKRAGADGTFRVWARPSPGSLYVLTLDPSQGVGGDNAAGVVLERGTGNHVATLWGNFKPEELARLAVIVARSYNDAEIAPERNNHGHVVLNNLGVGHAAIGLRAPWPHVFVDLDGQPGWNTTQTSRVLAVDVLDEAIRLGQVSTLDPDLLDECLSFITNERGKAEAAPGAHDDLVIALAIAWNVICRRKSTRRDFTSLPPR